MQDEGNENRDPSSVENSLSGKTSERSEANETEIQFLLGIKYLDDSNGQPEDQDLGLKLLYAAAEAGHGKAQYVLGSVMLTGEYGVPVDPIMGEIWIRRAISNKEPDAYVALWRALKDGSINGTLQEGVNALREGMMLGSTEAVCECGILYMEQAAELAEQDTAQSESLTNEGLHLLKIAARDGNLAAAAYLVAFKEGGRKEKGKKKKSAHGKKNRNKGK